MSVNRRAFVKVGVATVVASSGPMSAFSASNWKPDRQVDYVIGVGPGGSVDQIARLLQKIWTEHNLLPKGIRVENKPGGAGIFGVHELRKHPGDGHYLTATTYQGITNYLLGVWDEQSHERETVLGLLNQEYVGLAVSEKSDIKNVEDLIIRLKDDPGSVSIGVATALGGHIHIGAALPLRAAGVDVSKLNIVPYKSSNETLTNVIGGHLDVGAATTPNFVGRVKGGGIKILAISSEKRLEGEFAEVPTWHDEGVDADFYAMQGVIGPEGMSDDKRDFWIAALREAVADPQWRAFAKRNQWGTRALFGEDALDQLESATDEMRSILTDIGMIEKAS